MTSAAGHVMVSCSSSAEHDSLAGSAFREYLKALFEERGSSFPASVDYLRAVAMWDFERVLGSVTERVIATVSRPDLHWQNMEEVLGDITAITGLSPEELTRPEIAGLGDGDVDFDAVHGKLYEHPLYPAIEHLNYMDFEPALHRGRFVLGQLGRMGAERVRFLDAGCGPGVLLSLILQAKPEWIGHGIDISNSCRDYAEKLMQRKGVDDRARLDVGDVRDLPYDDAEFDLVVAIEVLEHVPDSEVGMRELLRVLKPGGHGIFALPVDLPLPMHLRNFDDVSDVLTFYKQFDVNIVRFECEEFMAGSRPFIDTSALVRKPF